MKYLVCGVLFGLIFSGCAINHKYEQYSPQTPTPSCRLIPQIVGMCQEPKEANRIKQFYQEMEEAKRQHNER